MRPRATSRRCLRVGLHEFVEAISNQKVLRFGSKRANANAFDCMMCTGDWWMGKIREL